MRPLVSILTATYNSPETLFNRALPSVMNQTYQNFEWIIVCDDCTDNTYETLLTLKDPRIKAIDFKKGFTYSADPTIRWHTAGVPPLNHALDLARGELIAHLDHDDAYFANHLEISVKHHLDNKDCDVTYTCAENVLKESNQRSGICGAPRGTMIAHCSVMYKEKHRSFKYSIEGKDPADRDRWDRMIKAGLNIHFINTTTTRLWTTPRTTARGYHPWYGISENDLKISFSQE